MKNFNTKALAVAAAAVCAAGANAGTVATTAKTYAVEGITSTTAVTLADIVYTMGVARASNQGFTVIVRQPAGSTTSLVCGSVPTVQVNNAGVAIVTVKRASATECAYDVDVTSNATNVAVGNTITFNGVAINSHGLATAGTAEKLNVALYDTGETARIDNSVDKQVTVANSGRAVTLSATTDNHTTADVNFNSGNSPLFGFLNTTTSNNGVADTNTTTTSTFNVSVNGTMVNAAGTAVTAANLLTNVAVTVTGDFSGLVTTFNAAAGNSVVTYNAVNPTVTYTAGGSSSTAAFTLASGTMTPTGATTVTVSLVTAATQALGTSRTFAVSGVVNPALAGAAKQTLDSNSWWTWTANAIQLASAFFNNDTANGNLTRFFFQNVGAAANYSATCYGETGVTVAYGTAKTGTLINGTTAVNASDICTFSTGKRGSIVFTVNSSAGKVKGVYQQALNGAAASYIALERPYGNNNSTNGANY